MFADSEFNEFAEVSSSAAVAVRPEVDEGATSTLTSTQVCMAQLPKYTLSTSCLIAANCPLRISGAVTVLISVIV